MSWQVFKSLLWVAIVWKKTFTVPILAMFSFKLVNMWQHMKECVEILKYVSIKFVQLDLVKCITWLEKSKKGR